jgi:hypothetical protein
MITYGSEKICLIIFEPVQPSRVLKNGLPGPRSEDAGWYQLWWAG